MASIHAIDMADNVKFYHRNFITGKSIIDLTAQYRNYGVTDDFRRAKMISKDNKSFHHALMVNSYDNNQYDSFFQPDSLTRTNLGEEGTSYWSAQKTGWFADRREPGYPKGASSEQIVAVFDMHRNNMWKKFYEFNELARWINPTAPNDGSTGQVQVNGIPHFIVSSATAAVGQNGGAPSGYTTVSGLSRTTYPQLKNWTATATDMSANGGQKKISQMIRRMRWVVPRQLPGEEAPALDYEILSHETPWELYQDQKYAFRGDDNISKDPAALRGSAKADNNTLMIQGVPWRWVDALSNSTTRDGTTNAAYNSAQPVYLLDHSTWIVYAAEGIFMDESEPRWSDSAHNVLNLHMDTIYQRVCVNPGANGVITFA
jgi:hypothetical protein